MDNQINTDITRGKTPIKTSRLGVMGDKLDQIMAKIPAPIKEYLRKFYLNKKIFWPLVGSFVLILLVLVLGLLFGGKQKVPQKSISSPTPFIAPTTAPCPPSDTLCGENEKLKNLKDQINSLDIKQSKLQLPQIQFDISF